MYLTITDRGDWSEARSVYQIDCGIRTNTVKSSLLSRASELVKPLMDEAPITRGRHYTYSVFTNEKEASATIPEVFRLLSLEPLLLHTLPAYL